MPSDKPQPGPAGKPLLVYTTFPNAAAAESVAASLLDRRLVACAAILPGMIALYTWQSERHRDAEVVMILKTCRHLMDPVVAAIKTLHPFENPAVVAFEPVGGSADYFAWMMAAMDQPLP